MEIQKNESDEFPALMLVETRRVAGEDPEIDSRLINEVESHLGAEAEAVSLRIAEILGEISLSATGETNSLLIDRPELSTLLARLEGLEAFMKLNRDFTSQPSIAEAS